MDKGYRIVRVYLQTDSFGVSNSANLGHNKIETNNCLVEETQCGCGGCARDCSNEWCVPIV